MAQKSSSSEGAGFRYLALAEKLQKDIECGKYGIGEKLPSERVLAKETNVSHLTIRQGIDVLVRKGLVRRELGSGTYVNATKTEPIIGILIGPSLVEESAHFYRALLKALEAEIADTPFSCRSYDGFNRTDPARVEDSPPFQQLLRDSRNHPVKGFIQISLTDPRWNEIKPLKRVPRSTHGEADRDVVIDYSYFGRSALDYAVRNDRRRVLYLRSFLNPQRDLGGLGDTAKRLKVPMPAVIQLEDDGRSLDVIAHDRVCELTKQWGKSGKRPDAIIVSDDIATRGVAIALIKAGISVPSDLLLITLANEGINHHYGVEAVRYSLSAQEIARKLIFVLEQRIRRADVDVPLAVTGGWTEQGAPQTNDRRETIAV